MKVVKFDKSVELVLASIGAAQSFYLSLHSFFEKKKNFKDFLLSAFFFTITLRIVKSIFWVYFDTTPNWFLNLGFIAHSAFGPLLLLYVFYYLYDVKWSHLSFLHFLPSIVLLAFVNQLTASNFWYLGGYKLLLYHQLIYSLLSIVLIVFKFPKKHKFSLSKKEIIWLSILVFGTFLLQVSYFSNYVLGLTPYLLGPIIYGVFIYFLSFFLIKNPQVLQKFKRHKKYQNINISKEDLYIVAAKIELLMVNEKLFLAADFNVKQLAIKLNQPVYLISHVVNKAFSKNFSEYINTYRIKEAQHMLLDKAYKNIKISSIAYESGFNSLSSFNIAFKKITGTTPSSFKNSLSDL
nr:helix-turn-helix domain-containing protein [uncultured Psychroserpens sp.]